MFDSPAYENLINTIEANKTSTESKEERDSAFWTAARKAFNADVAGDVKLVTGEIINVPTIEL